MIDEFTLECDEEALHAGIAPAVAGAAHARGDAVRVEQTLVARGWHTDCCDPSGAGARPWGVGATALW